MLIPAHPNDEALVNLYTEVYPKVPDMIEAAHEILQQATGQKTTTEIPVSYNGGISYGDDLKMSFRRHAVIITQKQGHDEEKSIRLNFHFVSQNDVHVICLSKETMRHEDFFKDAENALTLEEKKKFQKLLGDEFRLTL